MKAKDAIQQIARKRNMTPEQVEAEIRRSIRDAMQSKDPQAQKLWKQIAPDGKEPTVEEFLEFCARSIAKGNS